MKRFFLCFIAGLLVTQNCATAAITVKKAASVEKKETKAQDIGASLLPTALSLYQTVQQLNQQQQELSAECEPTTQEINWVNNMIKEWAKAGGSLQSGAKVGGMGPCGGGSSSYRDSIENNVRFDGEICYDRFESDADKSTVWFEYPKASIATYYIVDGEYQDTGKAKDKKVASNIYDVFNLIDFNTQDYTADEAAMANKLTAKLEKCAPAKLQAKKAAMWGDFVMNAVGGIGQKTNTGSIMETVSGLVTSGGGMGGALQSLGGVATQLLDK